MGPARSSVLLVLFVAGLTLGFVAARAITWYRHTRRDGGRLGPFGAWRLAGGVHIHHFVPGLALAGAAGLLAIVSADALVRGAATALAGVGAGIVVDELALLVHLDGDAYFDRRGRLSLWVGGASVVAGWLSAAMLWVGA
jgi:hypothetical protein